MSDAFILGIGAAIVGAVTLVVCLGKPFSVKWREDHSNPESHIGSGDAGA